MNEKKLKKIIRILTISFGIIALVGLGFIIFLNTSAGENFLKNFIAGQLEKNLQVKTEIGRLETNLISYLNAGQIAFYSETDSSLLLSVAKIKVNYNIFDLLFGEKNIDYLFIDSVLIAVQRDSLGNFNLPSLSSETNEEDSIFTLPVNLIYAKVSHLNIIYKDDYIPLNFSSSNFQTIITKGGKSDNYKLQTSFDSSRLDYFNKPLVINNLFTTCSIDEYLAVNVDAFKTDIAGVSLNGKLLKEAGTLSGKLNINGNLQNLLEVVTDNSLTDFSEGTLNADINFTQDNSSSLPGLSFTLKFPRYNIEGVPVNDLNLKGRFFSDTLNFYNLSFKTYDGSVNTSGWISFDSLLTHNFNLKASNLNINKFGAPDNSKNFIQKPLAVDLDLKSEGELLNLGSLKVKSEFAISDNQTAILDAKLLLNNNQLSQLSDSSLVHINSDIQLTDEGYRGKFNIKSSELNYILSLFDINDFDGSFESDGDLWGDWSSFNFNSTIKSPSVLYKGFLIADTLSALMSLNENGLFIDRSYFSGRITNIDSIAKLINFNGIDGDLTYLVSVSGPIKNLSGKITAQIENPVIGSYNFDQNEFNAVINKQSVNISDFKLKKDSLLVMADGSFNFNNNEGKLQLGVANTGSDKTDLINSTFIFNSTDDFSASVQTDGFHLKYVNEIFPYLEISDGELSCNLNLINQNNQLNADLPFSLTNVKRDNLVIDSAEGILKIYNDRFYADPVTLSINGNKVFINSSLELKRDRTGSYFVDGNSKTEGSLSGNQINLQALNTFIDDYLSLGGFSNIGFQWNGNLKKPNLNGKINFKDVGIYLPDSTNLVSDLNGNIDLGNSGIVINKITALYNNKPLSIKAGFNQPDTLTISTFLQITSDDTVLINTNALVKRDSININLETNKLDIALAGPFFPSLQEIKGTLGSKLVIYGPRNNPEIEGTIQLNDISYNPGFFNLDINNGYIFAHLDSNLIVLDTAYLDIGNGNLSANGNLFIDSNKIKDVNINLTGNNLQISDPEFFTLKLNHANFNLRQEIERYKLEGRVQFGTSKYIRNFELSDLWKMLIARTEGVLEGPSDEPLDLMNYIEDYSLRMSDSSGYFRNLDLDIELQNSDSIWIDNNVASIRIHPDVTINGSVETPVLSGRILVEENGKVRFLDREFEIKEGIIEFDNPERLNPTINLTAESYVTSTSGNVDNEETYLVKLTATGPLDDIDFNLTSEPALDGADIISLLSLGVTYQQLQASSDANTLLQNRAQVLTTLQLSNRFNNYFDKWLGDFIDIDKIGFGGNLFDLSEARFEVTKRWSDDVELSYSTGIEKLDKQILKAKIKLMKYLYLEGKTDQEDESGADLLFRIKFK